TGGWRATWPGASAWWAEGAGHRPPPSGAGLLHPVDRRVIAIGLHRFVRVVDVDAARPRQPLGQTVVAVAPAGRELRFELRHVDVGDPWVDGPLVDLVGRDEDLVELLPVAQAGVDDLDRSVGLGDETAGDVVDPHRLAHVEDERFAVATHRA